MPRALPQTSSGSKGRGASKLGVGPEVERDPARGPQSLQLSEKGGSLLEIWGWGGGRNEKEEL